MPRLPLCLALLAACGDNLNPTPVDMEYVVAVTDVGGDCGGTPLPDDQRAWLDLRLRVDGSVRMTGWVPSLLVQPSFIRLFPHDGELDVETKDQHGDVYRVQGALTMDGMDLSLDFPSYRPDGSGRPCRRRLRLQGPARGFLDAVSYDGVYPLHADYFGAYCANDPVPTVPIGSGALRIDARPEGGTLYMSLERVFWFAGPQPSSDGVIDWSGTFYLAGERGLEEVPGTFKGSFAPGAVGAILEFSDSTLAAGCRYRYAFTGAKRVASLEANLGVYRAVYRTFSTCGEEPSSFAYESDVELVDWGDGRVAVYEDNGSYLVERDGNALSASAGSEAEGEVLTFSADTTPPYLTFSFEDRIRAGDGTWCAIGWEADGVQRYFPEQPWEPAFHPDPPMTELPRAARRSMPPFAPDLGPLSRP